MDYTVTFTCGCIQVTGTPDHAASPYCSIHKVYPDVTDIRPVEDDANQSEADHYRSSAEDRNRL
jgi:hypothetical protein